MVARTDVVYLITTSRKAEVLVALLGKALALSANANGTH
jgi:hypothetical protein